MSSVIRVVDLWKQYEPGEQPNSAALRGTYLDIKTGEVIALYGKSGSGKTTLLNILAGLDRPTKGSVWIEGNDLETLGEEGRTQLRRKRLGFVFQFFNLLPTLTAFENVFLSLELAGKPNPESAIKALQAVGLESKGGRYPHELSGGEQQRVAIARAIAHRPLVVFADEPTAELDTHMGLQIMRLFRELVQNAGVTIVMTTHDTGMMDLADTVFSLEDGRIANG